MASSLLQAISSRLIAILMMILLVYGIEMIKMIHIAFTVARVMSFVSPVALSYGLANSKLRLHYQQWRQNMSH
jgi:hypothetical protein